MDHTPSSGHPGEPAHWLTGELAHRAPQGPHLFTEPRPWFDAGVNEFIAVLSEEEIRRERAKARELRQSPWWKRKRAAGVCHYCSNKFRADELTMDHLVPLVRGGRSTKGNLVPACKDCNTKKKNQLLFEWQRE